MGFAQSGPTPVAEDNMACIYISKLLVMYHKAKGWSDGALLHLYHGAGGRLFHQVAALGRGQATSYYDLGIGGTSA
eukprot:2869020-Rhodomonas_salina.1